LVVEDESDIAQLLKLHLEDLGCEVEVCHQGNSELARRLAIPLANSANSVRR
jgi:DNA-binding response OmpR family regulator